MSAHNFPKIYELLNIDLSKLGCVMYDLKPFENAWTMVLDGAGNVLYHAKDKSRFWIGGWVFDKPHVTLLYGLLKPAYESKELVDLALEGWSLNEVEVEKIGYFDSPFPDEPYWCIVAHVRIAPELQEGHDRLCMLPHIKTFPGFKAHSTICYIDKAQGTTYRDSLISTFNSLWQGRKMKVDKINYGSRD